MENKERWEIEVLECNGESKFRFRRFINNQICEGYGCVNQEIAIKYATNIFKGMEPNGKNRADKPFDLFPAIVTYEDAFELLKKFHRELKDIEQNLTSH